MINLIILAIITGLVVLSAYIHNKHAKNNCDIKHYEKIVAAGLSARSHRLIAEGVRIELMPYSWKKHEAHLEWVSKLYEYMDDFEEEVAASLPKGGELQAYAGIKLAIVSFSKSKQGNLDS